MPLECFPCRRVLLAFGLAAGLCATPHAATDTPEMLAAMRAHLRPLPEAIPHWEELPSELRRRMPQIRISMHRWSEEPAGRRVVINGLPVGEDSVAGLGLWLRRIEAEGVVLQFEDVLFRYPR